MRFEIANGKLVSFGDTAYICLTSENLSNLLTDDLDLSAEVIEVKLSGFSSQELMASSKGQNYGGLLPEDVFASPSEAWHHHHQQAELLIRRLQVAVHFMESVSARAAMASDSHYDQERAA